MSWEDAGVLVAEDSGAAGWADGGGYYVHDNMCDNVADVTPYYIRNLRTAAANCSDQCPSSTYQETNQVCLPCNIVGCRSCSQHECEDCLIFHLPIEGQCVYLYGGIFGVLALAVLLVGLVVSLRFCCLALVSSRNAEVLRTVLSHRRRAKVHDYALPGNPFYAYDQTNVRRQIISGLGPILYFRFLAFMVLLAFLLVIGLALGQLLGDVFGSSVVAAPVHALGLYLVALVVVVRLLCAQASAARLDAEEEPHLQNYALFAEGFPKSARSPHEVKAFFESILGFETEGVSVAYDHAEEVSFLDDRISRLVEKADTHLGVYPPELSGLETEATDSQDSHVLDCLPASGSAFVVFSREEDREFCSRRFAEIEKQLKEGLPLPEQQDSDEDDESSALLKDGSRYRRRPRGVKSGVRTGPSRAMLFRGKFPVRVSQAPEPCGVQWQNFAIRQGSKMVRVLVVFLVAVLLVAVVSAVLFAPAVLAAMSFVIIDEPTASQVSSITLEEAILSISLAVNNRILLAALRYAARMSGFLQKVHEDITFMCFGFVACLLSVFGPFVVAGIVAATETTRITRALATEWLFQVQWITFLVNEVWVLLFAVWNYWSAYFWIRQSRYVCVREGEAALTPDEFPLATRYVDILHGLTLVCVMIAIDERSLFTLAAQCVLLLYFTYAYFMDKYHFLRVCRQTYYTSPKLDASSHFLLLVPLAVLAWLPLRVVLSVPLPWQLEPWMLLVGWASSIVLSLLLLVVGRSCCGTPQRELSDAPYVEVASLMPYNYFNTNPVHVLRAMHFPSIVVPPIYPYRSGKEYLQGGQFSDYDDTVRLRETLMLLVKAPLKNIGGYGNSQDYS